jgi:Putative phage holin Dp-1
MTNSNPAPIEPENLVRDYLLSSRAYDVIKWLALIGLPALGSLYFALAQIWGLPNAEKVVGTIMVIDTFLGALLSLSAKSYAKSEAKYDGSIEVEQLPDGVKRYSLELNGDPSKLDEQSQVVFKVNPS